MNFGEYVHDVGMIKWLWYIWIWVDHIIIMPSHKGPLHQSNAEKYLYYTVIYMWWVSCCSYMLYYIPNRKEHQLGWWQTISTEVKSVSGEVLKDVQCKTKLYTCTWPLWLKHEVYLNICNKKRGNINRSCT